MKKTKIKLTLIVTIAFLLLVASVSCVKTGMNIVGKKNGEFSGYAFNFTGISEYNDDTLEVMNDASDFNLYLKIGDQICNKNQDKTKNSIYLIFVELTNSVSNETIKFDNQTIKIEKDKFKTINREPNKSVIHAHTVVFDKTKDNRLILQLYWISGNKKEVTGSAIFTKVDDKELSKSKHTFLTLGNLTKSIKDVKHRSNTEKVKSEAEQLESVLIQDTYDNDNGIRVSLNRNADNIIRGTNALMFVAAAPKQMNSDYGCPDPHIDWVKIYISSVGTNTFTVNPFNVYASNEDLVRPGRWEFDPSPDTGFTFEDFVDHGVPVEGYIYCDQEGTVYMDADTDISWTEFLTSSSSITGWAPVSKNNSEDHPDASFEVIAP